MSNEPKLALGDVAQGAFRVFQAEFGQTAIQIGWRRESLNRLGVIPPDRRSNARSEVNALFAAARKADTEGAVNRIVGQSGAVGFQASEHSRLARDQLLTSHGSSDSQWERLRTLKVIDEFFLTVRTETPMANRNPYPETALAMAYQVVLSTRQDDRNHLNGPSILKILLSKVLQGRWHVAADQLHSIRDQMDEAGEAGPRMSVHSMYSGFRFRMECYCIYRATEGRS